jgi:hypothetical protein
MSHAPYMQGNWVDSWLLMVGNQIVNLTPNPSFGHNLCFKCPNGSREPILNIYVPRSFQWYKEMFNRMAFDPCNWSLKIWESTRSPTFKVGAHLGVWVMLTLSHIPGLPFWHATLQALALVASPRLRLRQMTSWSSIVEKTNTFFNEMIYVTPKCAMQLHGHWNKMVPFMNPSIFVDFNNVVKFCNCTSWSINDTCSHCFLCRVCNYHIGNKDLIFIGHVKIGS